MDLSFLPKIVVKKITSSDSEQINWNVFISNILVICIGGALLSFDTKFFDKIPHFCLVKETIGIPCPGCGILRSIIELVNFHFLESIHYNPVGFIIVLSILGQTIFRLLTITGCISQNFINHQTRIINSIVITLLLANWIINLILTFKL